jgi:hypothetical protein
VTRTPSTRITTRIVSANTGHVLLVQEARVPSSSSLLDLQKLESGKHSQN